MPKRKKPIFRDVGEMILPSIASLGRGKFRNEEFGEKPMVRLVDKTPENSALVAKRAKQQMKPRKER
jgi:hypothetical protein